MSDEKLLELMKMVDPLTARVPPGVRAVADAIEAAVRVDVAAERDCRTCTRYTLHHRADVPHCSSPIRCVDASRYERADYVQLWEAEPVNAWF